MFCGHFYLLLKTSVFLEEPVEWKELKVTDILQKRKCRLAIPNIKVKDFRTFFGVLGETFSNFLLTGIHSMQG